MKLEKLQPGQIVYTISRQKMGNTSLKTIAIHPVQIISVDLGKQVVTASWNYNREQRFWKRDWSKWRAEKPITISNFLGQRRLMTREEIKRIQLEQ